MDMQNQNLPYQKIREIINDQCRNGFFGVHIEPTNACNTTCAMCPRDAMTRLPRMMNWDTFLRISEITSTDNMFIAVFSGFGEPLLHKDLPRMINYLKKNQNIIVKVTTNGSMLNRKIIDKLYGAGLDLLEISFIGTKKDSYRKYMSLEYDDILRSIEYIKNQGYKFCIASFETSLDNALAIKIFWSQRGITNIEVKGFHHRGNYLQEANNSLFIRSSGNYLQKDLDPSLRCHKISMFLHVNSDGHIIPCVQEINNRNILASVNDNSDYLSKLKEIKSVQLNNYDICQDCEMKSQDLIDYYTRFFLNYFPDFIVSKRM